MLKIRKKTLHPIRLLKTTTMENLKAWKFSPKPWWDADIKE